MRETIRETAKSKIASLENRLSGMFATIQPRKEFINRLGSRIHGGHRAVLVDKVADIHLVAVVAAGILSLIIFLVIVFRALLSLPSRKRHGKAQS